MLSASDDEDDEDDGIDEVFADERHIMTRSGEMPCSTICCGVTPIFDKERMISRNWVNAEESPVGGGGVGGGGGNG